MKFGAFIAAVRDVRSRWSTLRLIWRPVPSLSYRHCRLRELELLQRDGGFVPTVPTSAPELDAEDVEDLEDAPDDEVAAAEEEILDQATAAQTIAEMRRSASAGVIDAEP